MNETGLDLRDAVPGAPRSGGATALSADDVHKSYRMGRVTVPVLKGATLDVADGEWVAVLGSSGSGKSTLLHLLGDLDQADAGVIRFGDRALPEMSRRERDRYRNKSIGFVFQFYHLLPELNVVENTFLPALVGMSRFAYYAQRRDLRTRARDLLAGFGLDQRLDHRPRELSGGERQRVAIARGLINRPAVLLADEPTGNLDEHTGAEILDLLAAQHAGGLTIVMVTHDASIAARADRLVELHDGAVQTAASQSLTR